jgi:hypothetical protein
MIEPTRMEFRVGWAIQMKTRAKMNPTGMRTLRATRDQVVTVEGAGWDGTIISLSGKQAAEKLLFSSVLKGHGFQPCR